MSEQRAALLARVEKAERERAVLREALVEIATGGTPGGKVADWEFAARAEDREQAMRDRALVALNLAALDVTSEP